MKFEQKYPDTM